ncbi:MAG: Spy/CpxP family protein refolding chaperone [Candidatus Aminicenantia bacterium]
MKRKLLILGLILSIAINIGVLGSVGYHWLKRSGEERHHREGKHSPMSILGKELSLSQSQAREMESLRQSLEPKMEEIKKELREKRVQLVNLLMESEPDLEKINIQLTEIESLQTELQKLVIDHLLQEKKILSPEQQKRLFSIISKRLCPEGRHQGEGLLPMTEESEEECKHK